MALPPHWLDNVFTNPKDFVKNFLGSKQLWDAFTAAEKAYQSQKEALDKQPNLIGPTPNQAARQAFLDALNRADTAT